MPLTWHDWKPRHFPEDAHLQICHCGYLRVAINDIQPALAFAFCWFDRQTLWTDTRVAEGWWCMLTPGRLNLLSLSIS